MLHTAPDSFLKQVMHGGTTATANFNVTAALATITFGAIIVAGTKAHGFVKHWKNLVPHGLAWPIYILLIPIEIMGMFVRPFALTMRLAANMTGGHIAILAILSFVFLFAEMFGQALAGIGVGPGGVGAAGRRHLGARDHRRAGSGLRVHAADGRVHRHGHSRSSLETHTKGQRMNSVRFVASGTRWLPCGRRDRSGVFAQEAARLAIRPVLHLFGAALGLGMIVIGAGLGIGKFAAAAAEGIARQPAPPRRSPAP